MDFKNILSQLSTLSEATKETGKGRIHTAEPGGYGRKDDEDSEGNKVKQDAPKRGRGRPKKDADASGETKTYDTKTLGNVFGGGKKPKKEVGKVSKKHSLKEWVQEVENKYVAEAVPPGMKPLAILDPKNQNAGAGVVTSKNPAIQKMLGGLDPKDVQIVMTQQGQQAGQPQQQPTATSGGATNQPAMAENQPKPYRAQDTYLGAKHAEEQNAIAANKKAKSGEKAHAMYAAMKAADKKEVAEEGDYSAKSARAGKDIGKPGKQFSKIAASAGKKYGSKAAGERVAGAVLAKLRGLKEGDIPSDQMDMGAGLGAGRKQETFEGKKPDFLDLDKDGNKKESMKKAAADKKKKKVDESMDTRLKAAHLRGKSHALAKEGYNCRYDDMEEARMYHEGYKEGLDECYGQMPIVGQVVGEEDMPPATVGGMADAAMDEGNAFTRALAKTPQGGKFSVAGKTFTDRSGYDAKVDETMFESWDNELSSLLEEYNTIQEGMTVSISKGQQGMPDSVSVTAQDQEADQLLSIIKSAGLGLFGGDDAQQSLDGQSSPMSLQPADGGEEDIDVVGDHDGMMALIKKVTGGAGEPNTVAIGGDEHGQDYEDEEDSEEHDHDEDTDESTCEGCGMEESQCQCDHEQVDEVESEDQMTYEVAEDNPPDSGAAEEEEEIQDTAQANASAADSGGAPDDGEEEEVEESLQLDEWANEAGQNGTDAAFEADIAFMTKVIAGGLNKEKATGQTTVPVIAGQNDRMGYATNESISDWKKLAGLK